jgi:hypothetical protein
LLELFVSARNAAKVCEIENRLWCTEHLEHFRDLKQTANRTHSFLAGLQRRKNYVPHESSMQYHHDNLASNYELCNKDEFVYSFSVYSSVDDLREDSPTQRIDILGSLPISHLFQQIYCVQDEIQNVMDNDDIFVGVTSSSSSNELTDIQFLFAGGVAYVDADENELSTFEPAIRQWLFDRALTSSGLSIAGSKTSCPASTLSKNPAPAAPSPKISTPWSSIVSGAISGISSMKRKNSDWRSRADNKLPRTETGMQVPSYQYSGASDLKLISTRVTSCKDVALSLGKRQLFVHSRKCEHYIALTDVHVYHPAIDKQYVHEYPRLTFQSKMTRRACDVCESVCAEVVAYGDRLAETDPALFCR